jgi:predicted cobalt transporter CbtA
MHDDIPAFATKAEFARLIDRTPAMISKYLRTGRLIVTADGRVDVKATLARLRDTLDPSRGGKGGRSLGQDRLAELATDAVAPEGWYPADPEFREAADSIRASLMTNLDIALAALPTRDARAVREEFAQWLIPGTAGFAQALQQHVRRLRAPA